MLIQIQILQEQSETIDADSDTSGNTALNSIAMCITCNNHSDNFSRDLKQLAPSIV